jgi:hypothetical protein
MEHFLKNPIDRNNVAEIASKLSWENYANSILK